MEDFAPPEVFILAAGRGMRLRPLTDTTPKALLPLGAHSLIEHHLLRLREQGFTDVVINLAWLGEKIEGALGDGGRFGLRIRYSHEPPGALNTGGGVVHALRLLRGEEFIVINADIVTDFDFASLRISAQREMQLVLAPNPPHHPGGDYGIRGGELAAAGDAPAQTFTGIGRYRRCVFERAGHAMPRKFALRELIARAIADGVAGGELHRGIWFDIGTLDRLQQAREDISALR